jgi:hypothetical protein
MKKINLLIFYFLFALFAANSVKAQTTSASNYLIAHPVPDRTVYFGVADPGVSKPIEFGLDLAWLDGNNVRRGIAFMGKERVKIIRSSFVSSNSLVGDTALQGNALTSTNQRLDIISTLMGQGTNILLNHASETIDASFLSNPVNWTKLMKVTAKYHEARGFNVVSVAPFNEPDNTSAGQGTVQDFVNINTEVRNDAYFNGKRLCGPNTLNNDAFFNWYNPMKNQVNEGNTHQLAGSFDNYALTYQTLTADGKHATNDELHNVMEAMVGAEYGLQTGIWWGTAELARGEFCKASDGVRLGYAEHRPYWTAASVYRHLDGKVQAFAGMSERQSATTTYRYISKDRDVFYDGYGPQREYTVVMPGGAVGSYQNGQTNGERVVNITWGEDIQPVINGKYILVNRNSGKVVQAAGGSSALGTNLVQSTNIGSTYQQWNVNPVDSRIGGDFSYFSIINANSSRSFDLLNWSLEDGGSINQYDFAKGSNQQWYLDYAGDGWFYIRSRHSNKCIDADLSVVDGSNILQWEKNGGLNQQWRLLPVDAVVEFVAPSAPTNLVATANAESVLLTWTASPETDVAGYTIFRSETAGGTYNTIARNITSTSFVDNTTTLTGTYYYKIKAVDKSLNRSVYSNEVSATTTGANSLATQLMFDGNTLDNSVNLNHGATYGTISYVTGKVGTQAIALNGTDAFVQLPATLANQQNITIAAWVYWNGGNAWQRIFDFGNDMNQYMFLSPNTGSGTLRFGIRNGGAEQTLDAAALPTNVWSHVAVTMGTSGVTMYVNGVQVATSTAITIRPLDFKPILNYIGRSQWPDPLFNGNIDEFRVYNYDLSASEVNTLLGKTNQTITFNALPVKMVGDADFNPGATASSGLAVTYTSSNTAVATIVNGNIHVVAAGTSVITASQAGNDVFNPAANVTQTLTVDAGVVSGATYILTNLASGKCLDNLGSTVSGATVAQWGPSGSANQQWVITLSSGYYKLQCVTGSKYLDNIGHTTDGSTVGQKNSSTSKSQQWTLTKSGSYYKVINRANGKCLDTGGGMADGSIMQFWSSGSSSNQLWSLSRLISGRLNMKEAQLNEQEEELTSEITLYPNPIVDKLTVKTNGSESMRVEIFTMTGVKVYSENLENGMNSVDFKNLGSGIYFVKVYTGQNVITKQIIKK